MYTTKKRAALDWMFLRERSRELRAKENDKLHEDDVHKLFSAREDRIRTKESEENRQVVKVVNDATERMYIEDAKSARERTRRAAMSPCLVLSDIHRARGDENKPVVVVWILWRQNI